MTEKKLKEKCHWCNGKKVVTYGCTDEYTEYTETRKCHICNGTGKVDLEESIS